ncbi:uncharacterized protein LOC130054248 [Ostrea edulis]|uniref:uncharacterized protein LOC130054248 n=1 Tax=Ostrea edulis TaxID=37623 RepID=UPI0024AEDEAB|nr:uncharacterized protein LOC130054248 [Ostrea edulis]
MALSKLNLGLGTPQHFLECGIEDCEKNCEFYCNPCHQQMCKQCREKHLKNPEYKNHEVVLYQQRKQQLPVEKCKTHPTKDIDIFCKECKVPICSKCATLESHSGHKFIDLETIYAEKLLLCQEEVFKVHQYFLPTSQDLKEEIKGDAAEVKMIMNSIRTTMKADAESLKNMVDTVVSENIELVNKIEESLLEETSSQDDTINDYIAYLHDFVKEFHGFLSSPKITALIPKLFEKNLKIRSIPETTKPVTPVFTTGHYSKEDVVKLLGKVEIKDTKPEKRKRKPMEVSAPSIALKSKSKQRKQDREKKSDMKQTMSLSPTVTKVREFKVSGNWGGLLHISLDKSGRLWASDWDQLVQTDLQGNQLQKIKNYGEFGYHTVTQDGVLILADGANKVISRLKQDNTITEFIKTGDWTPDSLHSSHINGDILVGMRKGGKAKVTRYNKTGKELQNIQWDNKGQELYSYPRYITENINRDICTSDSDENGIVVVNRSGQHRFSYKGQKSGFSPWGICTDVLGHILVCDDTDKCVHFLDQDGQFLSLLLTEQQEVKYPYSVCVDGENNLYVGELYEVAVYKYLQ